VATYTDVPGAYAPAGYEPVSLEPWGDPPQDPVNPLAAQLLPEQVCRHFRMLPVSYMDGQLTVAVADPGDPLAQNVAQALTSEPVRFVVAPVDEIERAIERVFAGLGSYEAAESRPEETETVVRAGRLGEILVSRGLITEDELARTLELQEQTGSRLGEILYSERLIDEEELAAALADQLSVPFVDLEGIDPDPRAVAIIPEALQRGGRCLPLAVDDECLYVAITDPLDDETYEALSQQTDLRIRTYLARRSDLEGFLRRIHQSEYVRAARTELLTRFPDDCANRVLSAGQRAFFIGLLIVVGIGLVIDAFTTAIVLVVTSVVVYGAASLYKFILFYEAFGRRREIVVTDEEVAAIDERDCPIYTILVPLYRETEVLPRLIENLSALDYPKSKLEVLLLAEEDDIETIETIESLDLAPFFNLIVVPDSQPKTKPKACNYGLVQATGKYVVIYDAEDQPDIDQLKKVLVSWSRVDERVVCVQCKLNYFNTGQNLLTRFFATEYALWFDLLLPGLDASGAPIPLGGTSNHFDREVLLEIGAWDPFNVTEDADLGLRLHKDGYKTAMLDSTTLEEANSQLGNWIRQRSRWVKGYFQTYLVHMRHPLKLLREIGLRSFLSFQFIIGGTIIFILNPIFWALTTLWLLTEAGVIEALFPGPVYYIASLQLFIGNFVFTYLTVAGSLQRRLFDLTKYALFSPIYWGLMSIGAYRGFYQLFSKPFYWEKTEHGLDVGRRDQAG
jgi:cellulose synthase/poly-beta-1,6-N-acetylglucosamine synthase-like glycosyltransferase